MGQGQVYRKSARLSRRAVLRTGAAAGTLGAGLAVGATGTVLGAAGPVARPAVQVTHLEVDAVVGMPVSIVRAGSGPPQRGDWFHVDAQLFESGQTEGAQIGVYQCFGAWTHAATDTAARDQRLTSVQFRLTDRGSIFGLVNEGGADPNIHVGAVQGGTGEFAGAQGTFQQLILSGPSPGVAPGTTVFRAGFELMLPGMS